MVAISDGRGDEWGLGEPVAKPAVAGFFATKYFLSMEILNDRFT